MIIFFTSHFYQMLSDLEIDYPIVWKIINIYQEMFNGQNGNLWIVIAKF